MNKMVRQALGKLNIAIALTLAVVIAGILSGATYVLASSTASFTQVINAGTFSVDLVDGSYTPISSPTMPMSPATFSWTYQTTTGTFGSSTQRIYVKDPGVSKNWSVTMAATSTTSLWKSTASSTKKFDFNDPTANAVDGADADTVGGQMTVNPSTGSVSVGAATGCDTSGVAKGSSNAFSEGVTDSITLLTGTNSYSVCDWYLTGVSISQTIPAAQAPASDYKISMVLTGSTS